MGLLCMLVLVGMKGRVDIGDTMQLLRMAIKSAIASARSATHHFLVCTMPNPNRSVAKSSSRLGSIGGGLNRCGPHSRGAAG